MPQLISFPSLSGHLIWINPALVRTVGQSGKYVIVTFADDHSVSLEGDAASIANALSA